MLKKFFGMNSQEEEDDSKRQDREYLELVNNMKVKDSVSILQPHIGLSHLSSVLVEAQRCTVLKTLSLRQEHLNLDLCKSIAKLLSVTRTLVWFQIPHSKAQDEAIKILAKGIRKNRSLTWIDVSDNDFGDEGMIAICEALENHKFLMWLYASGNHYSKNSVSAFKRMMRKNRSMTRVQISFDSDVFSWEEILATNHSLLTVNIWSHPDQSSLLDANNDLCTRACQAAKAGDLETVKKLFELGISPNAEQGMSPLIHPAITSKSLPLVQFLVENNASLFEPVGGQNALAYAKKASSEEVYQYLRKVVEELKHDQVYDIDFREKTLLYFLWLRSVSDSPFYFDVLPLDLFKVIHSFTQLGFLSRD